MHRLPLLLALSLGVASCAPPAPPPSTPPPEVTPGTALIRPTANQLDPYVGRYVSGAEAVEVRRSGDGLAAVQASAAPTPLMLVGLGTFADPAGTAYLFNPAGTGMRLVTLGANGARREWSR